MTKVFLGSLLVGFIVLSVCLFIGFKWLTKDYEELKYDQSYNDEVLDIVTYKGVGYVTFSNNKKYKIYDSRNYNYEPYSLSKFLVEGDIIEKKEESDSVIILRSGKEYVFLLGQVIGER